MEHTPKKTPPNTGVNGDAWDRDDSELGALFRVAREAAIAASKKALNMRQNKRGALPVWKLESAEKVLNKLRGDLDNGWIATRPRNEHGPTPYWPNLENLPAPARDALEAIDRLRHGGAR